MLGITWVNATSFTVSDGSLLNVGEEVEILAGPNAGALVHIKSISSNTITIDETLTTSTAGGLARFDSFVKLDTISDQTIQSKLMSIAKKSSFIQIKVEMRGDETSPIIHQLVIESITKKR